LEDRVQLQRLYLAWVAPPRFDPVEAQLDVLVSILGEGHSSRLYRCLVYEKQIAREVNAHYGAMEIAGELRLDMSLVPGADVDEAERALFAEVERLQAEPPSDEEVQRAINRLEARRVRALESVGGFGGRANLLNHFNVFAGDPGRLNTDFDRHLRVTPADVQRVAQTYFGPGWVRLLVSPVEPVAPAAIEIDRTQQPGPGRTRDFRPPVPQRLQLASGADLLVVEKREVPTIVAGVYFPGGALTDPTDRPGLASLTSRLLTEGTQRRTSLQIADESEYIAARLNVTTYRESFLASTDVLTRHWPRALDLLADVLANPVFPEREVERVRKERVTDLRRLRDDANAIADRVSTGVLYGRDTPHGHPISGREEAIAAIAREELADLHARAYAGRQPTFIVAGDVDAEAVARELEAAFSHFSPFSAGAVAGSSAGERPHPGGELASRRAVRPVRPADSARGADSALGGRPDSVGTQPPPLPEGEGTDRIASPSSEQADAEVATPSGREADPEVASPSGRGRREAPGEGAGDLASLRAGTTIYLVDKPGAAQSVISAVQLTVPRLHPDYHPLVVMNMAFGGQFTARLNMNLREDKGYTYGYRSHFDWRVGRSSFIAGGSVQTAVTKEALIETLQEFRDLHGERPLSADEFEKARLGLIRGYPPTFETPGQILGRLYDIAHYGLPDDYFTHQIERLQAVTLADVHRVAAEHVNPEGLAIVVVGDRAVIEPRLEELSLPIVHLDHEGQPLD
jgi:predicted Zn-dependent peptidase